MKNKMKKSAAKSLISNPEILKQLKTENQNSSFARKQADDAAEARKQQNLERALSQMSTNSQLKKLLYVAEAIDQEALEVVERVAPTIIENIDVKPGVVLKQGDYLQSGGAYCTDQNRKWEKQIKAGQPFFNIAGCAKIRQTVAKSQEFELENMRT